MKHKKTMVLGALTLFFGFYAMVLELKGIANADQMLTAILLALLTYWSW
jgi:hypothetical protein